MIERRPFASLGAANHGWLDAKHHFSFANYYNPARMGWGPIRVWNDDAIAAGAGFPPHPHANMEIITYVRDGAITHEDSLGNSGRTEAGDVQVMSAGSGVRHSEYNREDVTTRIFQIWIEPTRPGRQALLGRQALPQGRPLRPVRHARQRLRRRRRRLADPRRRPRAGRDAEGGRERGIHARRGPSRLSRAGQGRRSRSTASTSTRATARRSRDEPVLRVTAIEDAEIVLVEAK